MAYDQTSPGTPIDSSNTAAPDPNNPGAAAAAAAQKAALAGQNQQTAGNQATAANPNASPHSWQDDNVDMQMGGAGGQAQAGSASSYPSGDTQTDWSQAYQPGQSGGVVGDPTGASSGLQQALTGRMNQGLAIDPSTDSVIKPQVDAYAANATRANRDLLNDTAESNGPYATGAQATARTQAAENEAQGINSLQTQLVQNELNARRGDIAGATSDLGGLLGADQQLNLQRQQGGVNANLSQQQLNNTLGLGMMGANLQQQGITNQNSQYYSGLSQADQQFLNNLSYQYAGLNSANTNAANQLGYQYAGLNSANSNFDKNLGYQYAGLNSANTNFNNNLDFQKQGLQSQNDQFAQNFGLNSTNQANYWDAIRSGLM